MKTTSIRCSESSGSLSAQSLTRAPISPRMSLRVFASRFSEFHSWSAIAPMPSGPATSRLSTRSTPASGPGREIRCSARRSTRLSKLVRTDLMSPSRASSPEAVQALYQTVLTPGASRSSASTSRIRLLLPIPHPASTARVNGVDRREATSSPASCSATRPAPSRSPPVADTGSSLSNENSRHAADAEEAARTGGGGGREVDAIGSVCQRGRRPRPTWRKTPGGRAYSPVR